MKFKTLLSAGVAAFSLLVATPALADQNTETTTSATVEASGPALWKVADEDTTIYLFGTVHLLPDDVDWNSGAVNDALASADALVTEVDLTPEKVASMGALFQSKGILTTGQTLRELMTDEQRTTYEEGLAKVGVPAAAFDQLEPWAASFALLQIVTQASGFTPEKGVETVLENLVNDDVERLGLETIEFQLSVFDELPIDQQILFLLEGAQDPAESLQDLNKLIVEWAEGDAAQLGKLMNEGLMAHPNLADRLLYDRNATWAEWIDNRLEASPGTVFMAVGAGHLAGEKSVQHYLGKRRITVERVQ